MGEESRLHGGPRNTIMIAAYAGELQEYICTKNMWSFIVFYSVHWNGFRAYMNKIDKVQQTHVIKLVHIV